VGFLDIILGGLLLFGLVRGIWKGFFVELASFFSLLIGIYIALKFSYLVKSIIGSHVSWNPKTIQITAFVLTFIVVVVGIYLLAKFFTTVADFAFLGWMNKLGGGVLGVLKTVLIVGIVLNIFLKINYNHFLAKQETLDKSLFFNPIQKVSAFIYPSIEDGVKGMKG
jgi:membrane protein required for colicin V production